MTTSNDYNIQASFNYTDREIDISLSAAGTGIADLDGGNTDIEFIYKVRDSYNSIIEGMLSVFNCITFVLNYVNNFFQKYAFFPSIKSIISSTFGIKVFIFIKSNVIL